ncbi:MAG: cytoplasmic protein [Deltaproteobacteria bacterium]|nr:cytoplasmic protein [Deltaproteobacteria bacterium]MBW2128767.1 cytoplasmic protein [Deltaproteobacteria bacterium]MBW2303808.1 cytoplasmic protein [Deltaproteobacteria bacterium]
MPPDPPINRNQRADFDEFEATELYCPECRRAVPVRKSLLLILPEGDKYEYRCQFCGSTVGDKIDRRGQFHDFTRG